MSTYLCLRAVPSPALRNSATWLERLFERDGRAVRNAPGRHHEGALDTSCPDQELLYTRACPPDAEDLPRSQAVLGGRPVFRSGRHTPPFRVLTAAQTRQVARFLTAADFDALWLLARDDLLPRHGGAAAEPETCGAFASAHRELTAFYTRAAGNGDAVVKRLPA